MSANGNGQSAPYSKARAIGGLFLIFIVGALAIIDAFSQDYAFDLGPMFAMLGTGGVLLGVEGIREVARKIVSGDDG